jgi:hypothetical protein
MTRRWVPLAAGIAAGLIVFADLTLSVLDLVNWAIFLTIMALCLLGPGLLAWGLIDTLRRRRSERDDGRE